MGWGHAVVMRRALVMLAGCPHARREPGKMYIVETESVTPKVPYGDAIVQKIRYGDEAGGERRGLASFITRGTPPLGTA
jgi:hypothetical protein